MCCSRKLTLSSQQLLLLTTLQCYVRWSPFLSSYFFYPLIYIEDNRAGKLSSWEQCNNFTVWIYSIWNNKRVVKMKDESQQIFKTVSFLFRYTFKTPKSFLYPINSHLPFPRRQIELWIPYNYGSPDASGFSVSLQSLLSHTKWSGCCSQRTLRCPFFQRNFFVRPRVLCSPQMVSLAGSSHSL